jgi:hypothetical protein
MTTRHLDAEAINRWVAGECDAATAAHLRECAMCSAAVARLEAAFAGFRNAAGRWTESQPLSRPPLHWEAHRHWTASRRWAAVAATVTLLAAFPAYRSYSRHEAAARAQADAQLLQEVSDDLARPAPEPLEPLIQLVSQSTTGDNR